VIDNCDREMVTKADNQNSKIVANHRLSTVSRHYMDAIGYFRRVGIQRRPDDRPFVCNGELWLLRLSHRTNYHFHISPSCCDSGSYRFFGLIPVVFLPSRPRNFSTNWRGIHREVHIVFHVEWMESSGHNYPRALDLHFLAQPLASFAKQVFVNL
jgi:hypothetical protein